MVTYIATIGESIEAVVNIFWEFLLRYTSRKDVYGKYLPNTFIALASKTDYVRGIKGTEEKLPEVKGRIIEVSRKILNDEFSIYNRIIDQEGPESIIREMINIHEERRDTIYSRCYR
ncbi:MAG: hypothetical protein GXO10_01695 [Crenarchaeota archaeon]|nr:hypothetical protein [Thermoproteota archaeon]